MHPLVDIETVETIRSTGNPDKQAPDRVGLLEAQGLPYDRAAENVVISGCQILRALPKVLSGLARIFDRGGLSYTFLSKEHCCGNSLYRPAIKAKDQDAVTECRALSKEFLGLNLRQAKELGAKRLIIFCSPCYPIYKYAFPNEEIVFYPQAISESIGSIRFEKEIDYYAGCYRLHRKFAPVPMDLKSADDVFSKLKGLSINRIRAPACCYEPDGIRHMLGSVKTEHMVHICTGCYFQALINLPKDGKRVQVLMLPELVEMAYS